MSDLEDYNLTKRINRLARIARQSASTQISVKRVTTQYNPETKKTEQILVDTPPEIIGNEVIILQWLLRTYLDPSALRET